MKHIEKHLENKERGVFVDKLNLTCLFEWGNIINYRPWDNWGPNSEANPSVECLGNFLKKKVNSRILKTGATKKLQSLVWDILGYWMRYRHGQTAVSRTWVGLIVQ